MESFKSIIFNSHNKEFKFPQGALPCGKTLTLRIFLHASLGQCSVFVRFWQNNAAQFYQMEKGSFFNSTPYGTFLQEYRINVSRETIGLSWYSFIVKSGENVFYVGNNEDMLGGECVIRASEDYRYGFQLTVYDESFAVPSWCKGAIMYQIFPDRFARGGEPAEKKAKYHENWNDAPDFLPDPEKGYYAADDFFGGNIRGITEKLDYLKSLHVDVIYLNPIFKAYSNHRYDTGDYELVDPLFGSNEEFSQFCEKAKEAGIRIILDGVFSHTGSNSKYFNRDGEYSSLGAYQSQESQYFNWYDFQRFPDKYTSWWGIWSLPCVNENDPFYRDYILTNENSIVKRWLRAGISGWRLDVADELPDDFLVLLRKSVKEEDPDALILGEVWEDASNKISYEKQREFLYGNELDSVMNYPLKNAIMQFVSQKCTAQAFCRKILSLRENYPECTFYSLMNFISTHDTPRATTALARNTDSLSREEKAQVVLSREEYIYARQLHKLAALIIFSLPGMPCIYYGDEAGVTGCSDPFNRKTYPWGNEDNELLSWYRGLTFCRDDVMRNGELDLACCGSLLSIKRTLEKNSYCVLVNPCDDPVETIIDFSYFPCTPSILLSCSEGIQFSLRETGYYLLLPAKGGVIFKCFT